jgi:chitodextrinase
MKIRTLLAALALVAAGPVVVQSTPAAADSEATLRFHCSYPMIGARPLTVTISTNLPAEVQAGRPTPPIEARTVATISADTTPGMVLVGAKTMEGEAIASATITTPGAQPLDLEVDANLEKATVPSSGAFDAVAVAEIAPITFTQPGEARITVSHLLLRITLRDAQGRLTGLHTFDSDCTLDPGQDGVIATTTVTGGADTQPPTAPTGLKADAVTSTSVGLSWTPSTDNVGVTGYDVYRGTTKVASSTETSATVAGLSPTTAYTFHVKARDAAGNVSPSSSPISVTTMPDKPAEVEYAYTLEGSAKLAKTGSTAVLNGSVDATLTTASGAFTADVELGDTSTQFLAWGVLPMTATIALEPVGATTGTLVGQSLTSVTRLDVNIRTIDAFGFPMGGGPQCRTAAPVTVPLASASGWSPAAGGTVAGTFALGQFENCGWLTSAINQSVVGDGNTVTATLTPRT